MIRAEQACVTAELGLERHDRVAAERDFRAALALAGDGDGDGADGDALRARVHVGLGRVQLADRDADEAAVEFERAHVLLPDGADPLHWLGCAAAHRAAYESADEYFTSALRCARPHPRSLVQRAYTRVRLRRYEDALDDLRAAAAAPGDGDGSLGSLDADARWLMAALSGKAEGEFESVPQYAVALVLRGRREVAIELLEHAAHRDPGNHRITHTLALALLNSTGAEDRKDVSSASRRWERCVAAWGALLHDDSFWESRRSSAEERFGVTVEAVTDAELRADLRELLERRMPEHDAGGRVPPGALLQRESDAARILAGVGGFPAADEASAPLVCGPLRIAQLGLVDAFGAFAAGTPGSSLTYAFSELGFAQLLLKQEKPADALAALTELRCRECRERKDGTGRAGAPAAVCEPGCGRFDELNPAYAGHPDKHRRLARDARGLALRARLDLGRAELSAGRPDFGSAAASWRRALVHSRELERYRETQTAVVDLALGAARAAHRAGDLTRAVATLEVAHSITGANERGRLEGQLARLLADRGISVANRDGSLLDAPADDLRRSVAFNPHLLRAQVSLGVVLRGLAARRWRSGSVSGARATLREAMDQLTAALVHFPDDPDLTEQFDAAAADLDHVAAEHQATTAHQATGAHQESGR
ncbi:hypothetical protein ACGFSB_07485 [Streptomyces sp. NPDC048441]|uniref:hypothetical protein n=1 Tax=Streptomyces sp. NPDC048441 TaxID=3365552 RepID=UPI0037217595